MSAIREFAKSLPVVPQVYRTLRRGYHIWKDPLSPFNLRRRSHEQIFSEIFKANSWSGEGSVSGTGSDLEQTKAIIKELPRVLSQFGIQSMLDLPCGDFHWMQKVDYGTCKYLGADIVPDIIARNQQRYASEQRRFTQLNVLEDELPKVDLIFSRDCLVHFTCGDVVRALKNIRDSGSTYLMTTTFLHRQVNTDILTGQWRPLNLEVAPFNFPKPLYCLMEECTEGDGAYADKALGLWRIADIPTS